MSDKSPRLLTDNDLYLFNEGSHYRLFDRMGAHLATNNGQAVERRCSQTRAPLLIRNLGRFHPRRNSRHAL